MLTRLRLLFSKFPKVYCRNVKYDNDIEARKTYATVESILSPKPVVEGTKKPLLILINIFLISTVLLILVYYNFPELESNEKPFFKVPKNIEDAKSLGAVLSKYKDRSYFTVLTGFLLTYLFLQTFSIPGSISLSILSGYLYSFPLALGLVCLCSAIGASFCYGLSYLIGKRLVTTYFPDKIAKWSRQVNNHQANLLNYMIFLRITPIMPNWFINITSPIIAIPLSTFFIGTFLGVAPQSVLAIRAGIMLQQMSSSRDAFSWSNIALLAAASLLAIAPIVVRRIFKTKVNS